VRVPKDSIDLAQMRETLRSAGYRMIAERMTDQHAAAVRELITCEDWAKARYLQGRIDAIARAIALPKIIDEEIRAKQRKNHTEEMD
jgi:hypothetical protein